MSVKVAINGFGRIGRLAFRQMFGAEGFEVVAINDLTSPKMLAHLLKYDSTQGAYAAPFGTHTVEAGEDNIVVDGKKITIYAKANAAELPWGELGVDVVLECTGFYTSKAKAQAHIDAGAKVENRSPVMMRGVGRGDALRLIFILEWLAVDQSTDHDGIAAAFVQSRDPLAALRVGSGLHDGDCPDGFAIGKRFRNKEIGMSQQKTAGAELQDRWLIVHDLLP